jgi:hypothetical protein
MPERFSPNATTRPAVGGTNPESTLSSVVLPAPLGPMSPTVPTGSSARTASRDTTPPNRTVRSSMRIIVPPAGST